MIDSLFVLTEGGDVLIEKHWRGRKKRGEICDAFMEFVAKASRPEEVLPVLETPETYLLNIFRHRMFFVGSTDTESPPLMAIEFMQRVVEVLFDYFGGKLSAAAVRDNFVTVYQLLDEMLDNGSPLVRPYPAKGHRVLPPVGTAAAAATSAWW